MKKQLLHRLLFSAILIPLIFTSSSNANTLPLFSTEYALMIDGIAIATEKRALSYENNAYIFRANAKTTGIFALFKPVQIKAYSRFKLIDKNIHTQTYRLSKYSNNTIKEDTQLSVDKDVLTNISTNKHYPLNPKNHYLDKFNLFIALSKALREDLHKKEHTFFIIAKNGVKTYRFSKVGKRQIKLDDKNINTIYLIRRHKGRFLEVWLDPKQYYLPVKIKQKDKKNTYQYTLKSVKFESK